MGDVSAKPKASKHKRATVINKVRPTVRATWMLSRASRDRNLQREDSQVLSQDVPLSVPDAEEQTKTTPRHPVVNIHKGNEKEHMALAPRGPKKVRQISTVLGLAMSVCKLAQCVCTVLQNEYMDQLSETLVDSG